MYPFIVKPDNGEPYEVTAGPRDILVWEKTTRGKSFGGDLMDVKALQLTDMYKLAWIASRRLGLFAGTLQEFEESVDLIGNQPDGEPDPTQPAP